MRRTTAINLDAIVQETIGPIVIALALAILVLLVLVILLLRRLGRIRARLDSITRGEDGRSLEAILSAHLEKVHVASRDVDLLEARAALIESDLRRSLGRVGLVRFNPFEDTGGNQSFALAIIDAQGDGFVINSLHTRTSTRLYAKAVTGGKSDTALSAEETEALTIALARPVAVTG